ncbi:MAG: nucleotidyl transferase AbiEii/AbiGii toxin family protein [Chloroflexi bacterium]|nr:nucleotidyl transferase AbiEii/AbiGii toxin family protein [Chloroflexota bacterium]
MARPTRQSPKSRVADVLTGWQDRLLQLDRRKGLLNFRTRTTAAKIVDWLPDRIFASLSGNTAGLRFDYAEPPVRRNWGLTEEYGIDEAEVEDPPLFVPGDLSSDGTPVELQRRLRNLMRRTNEFREEQGLSVPYLALGLLEWVDTDGRVLTSPLLLLPCELERTSPHLALRRRRPGGQHNSGRQAEKRLEVVAEKLRATRQQVERLENRSWMRNRARDYYDLWRVMGNCWDLLGLENFLDRIRSKCRLRDVDFEGPEDFFDQRMVDDVERRWEASLGPLIADFPSVATLMDELRPRVEALCGPEG